MPTSNGNLAPTANGIKEVYSNDDSYRCERPAALCEVLRVFHTLTTLSCYCSES